MKNDHACQTNVSQLYVISYLLDNRDQILAKISKFDQKKKTNMILYLFKSADIQSYRPYSLKILHYLCVTRL